MELENAFCCRYFGETRAGDKKYFLGGQEVFKRLVVFTKMAPDRGGDSDAKLGCGGWI